MTIIDFKRLRSSRKPFLRAKTNNEIFLKILGIFYSSKEIFCSLLRIFPSKCQCVVSKGFNGSSGIFLLFTMVVVSWISLDIVRYINFGFNGFTRIFFPEIKYYFYNNPIFALMVFYVLYSWSYIWKNTTNTQLLPNNLEPIWSLQLSLLSNCL